MIFLLAFKFLLSWVAHGIMDRTMNKAQAKFFLGLCLYSHHLALFLYTNTFFQNKSLLCLEGEKHLPTTLYIGSLMNHSL